MSDMTYNKQELYELFFGTLANPCRLDIITALRKRALNVTQICKSVRCHQTTISHNLHRLKQCGFVFVKKKGKERVYSLNNQTIAPLMKFIDQHMNTYCKKCMVNSKQRR